jgi:hypothetical protein
MKTLRRDRQQPAACSNKTSDKEWLKVSVAKAKVKDLSVQKMR